MASKFPISLFGALIFFVFLWWLDFPKPHIDDVSYIGASLNMASGGDFSCPYISRQFAEHFAFFYPPIHSYVLAGWLKIFGISTASLTGFQMIMYLLCAGSAIFILRRHQAPIWIEWLAPLAVANAYITDGLRPEPFAAAFIIVGFAMIECGLRNRLLVFVAFLLMSLGGAAAPRMTFYAVALILFSAWRVCGPTAKDNRERWTMLGVLLGAGVSAGIIFLAMIQFKLKEFWETFHQNSQRLAGGTVGSFLLTHVSYAQVAIIVLFAIAAVFVLRRPKDDLTRICIVIAAVFPLEFLARFTGYGASRWYAMLILLFITASFCKRLPAPWKTLLQSGLCLVLLLLNIGLFANVVGILSGRIQGKPSQPSLPAITSGHAVLVDCVAARYYFNYRIPKDYVDFTFSLPFPYETPIEGTRPTDIYLIGPENLDLLKDKGGLDYQPMEKWSPLGTGKRTSKLSFYKDPQQVFMIPAPLCKSLTIGVSPDTHP